MTSSLFTVAFDDQSSVLSVSGDVDEGDAASLRDAIEQHSAGFTRPLSVDLSAVTYLPSVTIGVLAKARQRFPDSSSLGLVAADGTIAQRVLIVCALPFTAS